MTNKHAYCVCYNTLDVFISKENAERFYTTCYYSCDPASSEAQRYASILIDLRGSKIAIDGDDDYNDVVNRVVFFDENNKRTKEIKCDWMNYKKAIEQVESGAIDDK